MALLPLEPHAIEPALEAVAGHVRRGGASHRARAGRRSPRPLARRVETAAALPGLGGRCEGRKGRRGSPAAVRHHAAAVQGGRRGGLPDGRRRASPARSRPRERHADAGHLGPLHRGGSRLVSGRAADRCTGPQGHSDHSGWRR